MPAVAHLIVSLPPGVDGIRDYAVRLAEGLHALGIQSEFLAARGDGPRTVRLNGFPARGLADRDADLLARELAGSGVQVVLLHYSGYGYAPRGAPSWLLRGLTRWKAADPRRRVVVMFHELWATGPPWRSSFWMWPLQRSIVAGVCRLADAFITNTERHAAGLIRLAPTREPFAVLPVLSNLGEPQGVPPCKAREPVAVVFGQRGRRERVYARIGKFLAPLRAMGIEQVYDIGPPIDERCFRGCPIPVTRLGYLGSRPVSDVLLRSRVGMLDYRLDFVAKSGNLAAYAAHGVVPLIRSAVAGNYDGIRHGLNVVRIGEPIENLRDPCVASRVARAARSWYEQHALEHTAATFARAITGDCDGR
jgi:hypothetical protein